MTIGKLAGCVFAVILAGLFLVYILLDPSSQACLAEQQTHPGKVCTRHTELALVLTLVITALTTLFGCLALPGSRDPEGNFRESRIRFSIAITVLVLYLVFFGMSVFWTDGANKDMVATLTNLLMVVIP